MIHITILYSPWYSPDPPIFSIYIYPSYCDIIKNIKYPLPNCSLMKNCHLKITYHPLQNTHLNFNLFDF